MPRSHHEATSDATRAADGGPGEPARLRSENASLYAVIDLVGSSLDLDRVLEGVVDIATEATRCHACFVYFVEGERLVLRAASPRYRALTGQLSFGLDEGLAGWVARHRTPQFIRDDALSDPRVNYVAELEEERFQSMVAVPVPARSGDVLGVIVLHTEAPREFDPEVVNLLVSTASLVAGAIENAQLYTAARRQLAAMTRLSRLSQSIASATRAGEVHDALTAGSRALLDADACVVLRFDEQAHAFSAEASSPGGVVRRGTRLEASRVLLELMRRDIIQVAQGAQSIGGAIAQALAPGFEAGTILVAPLSAGEEHLGLLAVLSESQRQFRDEEVDLLRAVAHQGAVALRKIDVIDRMTVADVVADLFDALETGPDRIIAAKAAQAGRDLGTGHRVVCVAPGTAHRAARAAWPEVVARLRTGLKGIDPGALVDERDDGVAVLVAVLDTATDRLGPRLDTLASTDGIVCGVSLVFTGPAGARRGLAEARDALSIARLQRPAGGAMAYDELGVYRYLVRLGSGDEPDDRHRAAISRLRGHDDERGSDLLATLERYLHDRRGVTETARALFIHPNTLRQRLRRIERVGGLDLDREDLLALEVAIKLDRLRPAAAPAHLDIGA